MIFHELLHASAILTAFALACTGSFVFGWMACRMVHKPAPREWWRGA